MKLHTLLALHGLSSVVPVSGLFRREWPLAKRQEAAAAATVTATASAEATASVTTVFSSITIIQTVAQCDPSASGASIGVSPLTASSNYTGGVATVALGTGAFSIDAVGTGVVGTGVVGTGVVGTGASVVLPLLVNSTSDPFAPTASYATSAFATAATDSGLLADPTATGPGPYAIGSGSNYSSPPGTGLSVILPVPVGTGSASNSVVAAATGTSGVLPVYVNTTSPELAPVPYGTSMLSGVVVASGSIPASASVAASGSIVSPLNSTALGPTDPVGTGSVLISTGSAVVIAPLPTGLVPAASANSTEVSPVGSIGSLSGPFSSSPSANATTSASIATLSEGGTTLEATATAPTASANVSASVLISAAVTQAPSVTLAPVYSSALVNLTSGISTEALTSIVPSASVDGVVSSYIAGLTSALPEAAQPTGAVPTAIPSTVSNGSSTSPYAGLPHGGLTLREVFAWIRYIVSEAFSDGNSEYYGEESSGSGYKNKRAHARDVLAGH